MGSVRSLRVVAVVFALAWSAIAHAECVSQMREASSGVFNRTTAGVAWTGTLLGVAKVDGSGAREITFATYSEGLVPLTSDRLIAGGSFAGVTDLVWNGSELGVFYVDATGQLILQRVSTTGEPIGGSIAVAPNHPTSKAREYDADWDPSRQAYVIVHSVLDGLDKGLWLTILERNGSVRNEIVVTAIIATPLHPHVAVNSSGSIGVLFLRNGVYSSRVFDAAGTGSGIEPLVNARDAVIGSDGSSFVVAGNAPITGPTDIDFAIVDEHGRITMPSTKLFGRGAEIQPVSLIWNPTRSEWALAYLSSLFPFTQVSGDFRLRRFTASGDLISDSNFSPDPILSKLATSLPIVWTGSSYVSAASRGASGSLQPDSYVVRHCPLTATIGVPAQVVRAGTSVTFTANIDGGAGGNTYSWDFGDGRRSDQGTVTLRFDKLGDYPVVLRVTDAAGATSVTTMTLRIVTPRRRAAQH
ncbi:MAG TPA: PKD domain-containing protein [Thermoanaerobaculia bacterium]|nr:PKD domain-containing protein [Thermoanaerobaculia bacterium]